MPLFVVFVSVPLARMFSVSGAPPLFVTTLADCKSSVPLTFSTGPFEVAKPSVTTPPPATLSVRCASVFAAPVPSVNVLPAGKVVAPVPDCVPPVHEKVPVTVSVLVPVSVPVVC